MRGFGECVAGEEGFLAIPVCEPAATPQKYGEKYVKVKELKPIIRASTPSYYYEESEE